MPKECSEYKERENAWSDNNGDDNEGLLDNGPPVRPTSFDKAEDAVPDTRTPVRPALFDQVEDAIQAVGGIRQHQGDISKLFGINNIGNTHIDIYRFRYCRRLCRILLFCLAFLLFVKGEGALPITSGSIHGLPRAWRHEFRKPPETDQVCCSWIYPRPPRSTLHQ
jgi:hypothetical protein